MAKMKKRQSAFIGDAVPGKTTAAANQVSDPSQPEGAVEMADEGPD